MPRAFFLTHDVDAALAVHFVMLTSTVSHLQTGQEWRKVYFISKMGDICII